MSNVVQRVWLILAKIKVVAENPVQLRVGSEALVQCFVPVTVLETALSACDELLQQEGMLRIDVLKCVSFEEVDEEDDIPAFVERNISRARNSGKPVTGAFFTSTEEDSSSFVN
jgi:hypothetical protein